MRFGIAKLPNSRERVIALPTIVTDSAYFGSVGSACRFCLLAFAGFDTRPSTNLSSPASAESRAHSSADRRFLILSSMARELYLRAGLRAAPGVARRDHRADRLALPGREPRAPDVADEDDPHLAAVVPRLVLDRVVEHPRLAQAPLTPLAADAEAAARRQHERQVHDQAEVGDAGVRRDPRPRLQHGEHRGRRAQFHESLRQAADRGHRRGRARAAPGNLAALVVEVEGAPARRLVELAPLLERQVLVVLDIRCEALLVLDQDAGE